MIAHSTKNTLEYRESIKNNPSAIKQYNRTVAAAGLIYAAPALAEAGPALWSIGSKVWNWAAANPLTTTYATGTVLNAIDPNPAADWTPGLPGDEVLGNAVGNGLRMLENSKVGKWVTESTAGWSAAAKSYQEFVTGVKAGNAFEVNGVRFDGSVGDVLLEAKSSYDNFVNKSTGAFYDWFTKGKKSLINQAKNQLEAADGATIQWYFKTEETMNATQQLLNEAGIEGIEYYYKPID
jgi:hypothetical protein